MIIKGIIHKEFYDYGGSKYFCIVVEDTDQLKILNSKDHGVKNTSVVGDILRVKVPFRHRRPVVETIGLYGIRSGKTGDNVKIEIEYKGQWKVFNNTGTTWILKSYESL
jgi:hypothetical protein